MSTFTVVLIRTGGEEEEERKGSASAQAPEKMQLVSNIHCL